MKTVRPVAPNVATRLVVAHHYLHRKPPITASHGLIIDGQIRGIVTYGVPASRHLQMGACPTDPERVLELNRLWVHDDEPGNTESWFVTRSLRLLPPARIVVSYADLSRGHVGYIYRALNWNYAGWTDMDRHTPRLDYLPHTTTEDTLFGPVESRPRHTREATRSGTASVVRREPKVRYWTTTGTRADRRTAERLCGWAQMSWHDQPPPEPT